ncbi:P-loop containing nucleoside triphosphate hydrolase protein [Linderina pennispora]|uniref:p-loop containing nucleoside triphosphate hydrolase protein n=1 Tax=Linderina pennispora TaxID=61395 RepID=A0A1Y1VT40_9FUNG|nr:P-loop containing nucleoside triphosphate hydrolase protein [Linderina pennispora]ORX64447.1 P-loop containing nucleoside triphosphate hydrolase protein [Linderina pennispora]
MPQELPPKDIAADLESGVSGDEAEGDRIEINTSSTMEPSIPPPMCSFADLGLDPWLVDTLGAMSISEPTEIQRACIPPILVGHDAIGGAKTGSGKTAAFASRSCRSLFALVLTPTRELAYQIAEQFNVLGKGVNIKVTVAIGGMDMVKQALELSRRPHIVVATPGRLADHIESSANAVHFQKVKFLVLDEADRLLTETFAPDMAVHYEHILQLREKPSKQPVFTHLCDTSVSTVSSLVQNYIFVPSHVKEAYLVHLLMSNVSKLEKRRGQPKLNDDGDDSDPIMIFVGQCKQAESLRVMLFELGFRVTALHSKISQQERLNSLGKFRAEAVRILIATDVASLELVVNMHVPRDPDEYIHRVGRTARAGRGGRAITIMSESDIKLIHNIEARIGKQLEEMPISEKKVLEGMGKVLRAKRTAALHLLESNFGERDKIRNKSAAATAVHGRESGQRIRITNVTNI